MAATTVFRLVVNQHGDWSFLGRATSEVGSGAESPVPSEGFLILPSDLSSILVEVFDPTGANPTIPIFSATPSPATVVTSTLKTGNIWTALVGGGNFEYKFPPNVFALPSHNYLVVFTLTASNGVISYGQADVHTQKVGT
jgi:hypothetical protein